MQMRITIIAVAGLLTLATSATAEISGNVVKLGVLNDMSSLYADISGAGSVEAARMAIADFGGTVNGKKIELISADHQNKPDVGSAIATTSSSTAGSSTRSATPISRKTSTSCTSILGSDE
jgi:branched-chain amino acid transport system substrate-binding protein